MPKSGMLVDIYRNADDYDCTNNGLSSKERNAKRAILLDIGPFEPKDHPEFPVFKIDRRDWPKNSIRAVPEDGPDGYMFGGNFLYSSDSRFAKLNHGFPIPIHDRKEY